MALIHRGSRGFVYHEPFGTLLDWPDFFRRLERVGPQFGESFLRIEEYVEDGALVIHAELPGIDPDKDVELTIGDSALYIRAERRQETKRDEEGYYRSDLRYGSFTRTVALPVGVKEEDITATYKDGILEIRIPFEEKAAATTRIPIKQS